MRISSLPSVLNIVGFSLFTAFAQLTAATSRVTILAYTMPIWAALLARFVLGERFTVNRSISLALCVSGLAVLVYPLAEHGIPGGLLLAIGAGVSWAAGTIYQKWARIDGDPVGVAAWQVAVGFLIMAACVLIFEGTPHLWPVSWAGGIRRGLYRRGGFRDRLSALVRGGAAAAGDDGIARRAQLSGGRRACVRGDPWRAARRLADVIGFLLIFAASACVLIQPRQVIPAS